MKIAFLIPATSRGREWSSIKESYLLKYTLKTYGITQDKEHIYRFYIGIDRGDTIYDTRDAHTYLEKMASIMHNTSIEFLYMDGIDKGHLTVMWNRLFKKAYDDGYDYFFQCGDDISFETHGWINACIGQLEKTAGYGMTGPINNNARILTQSFVSRRHMELFGFFFPEEIINWCCDDWINEVYIGLNMFYPLYSHLCVNVGGQPRYQINNDPSFHIRSKSLEQLRSNTNIISSRDIKVASEKLKMSLQ